MSSSLLTLTEAAGSKIRELQQERDLPGAALRVTVREQGPAAFEYALQFVPPESRSAADVELDLDGILVCVDEESVPNLRGTTLDYVETLQGSGFSFDNPNLPPLLRDPLARRVHDVIESQINPGLATHGGRATLLDVKDGTVYLEFGGGCQGCGMVDVTLKQGIEEVIKAEIPEIHRVLDTTDHDAGTNPYYGGSR